MCECARETTWFFIPGTGGGGGDTGEDLTVKMGSHGDNNTSLIGFGGIPMSGAGGEWKSEGPHGNDGNVVGDVNGGSVELTGDTPMGIKGISWPIDNEGTMHHEIWTSTDDGANWTMKAQFQGRVGEGKKGPVPQLTCPVPPDEDGVCQDTLRIDGIVGTPEEHFQRRSMVEIQSPPGEPTGGGTAPAEIPTQNRGDDEGGDTTPPATTPPAAEEDEEDEDEDSGGDEDEEDEDDNGENAEEFDEDSPAAREQNDRINQCRNLTGATQRACMAGAAQSPRRGNLARSVGPVTRAMLSAYSPNYFKFNRRRIRIGNVR